MVLLSLRRLPHALVLLALSGAALAGCIDDGNTPGGDDKDGLAAVEPVELYETPLVPDFDFTTAIEIVHDHANRALHENNFGLNLVGFNSLYEGLDIPWGGGYIDVDVRGDMAVVATLMGPRGFTLVDISDKSAPQVLGHAYSNEDNWDSRMSEDGKWVFLGCQGGGLVAEVPVGNCNDYSGVPGAGPGMDNGVVTVDVTDPTNPTPVCFTAGGSVHNLETATLDDGRVLVATSAGDLFVLKDDGCLELASNFAAVHDTFLQKHPITMQMLLYTGPSGGTIYVVDDPANPVELGILDPAGFEEATMWHEQSPAPHLIRGRHLTAGAGEDSGGAPGPVTIIDTTDPATPTAIGQWILPVPPPMGRDELYSQNSYTFSEHNVDISPLGQVCVGHYHAGLWVFDISTEERMREPVTLAFFQPSELVPENTVAFHPAGGPWLGSPWVWGCQWTEDGKYIVTADNNSGLYILEATWLEPVSSA